MNRIILIGNGFDLAHGLNTSYYHFINKFWSDKKKEIIANLHKNLNFYRYNDNLISLSSPFDINNISKFINNKPGYEWLRALANYNNTVSIDGKKYRISIIIKNRFLKKISDMNSPFYWVDIESYYYRILLNCKNIKNTNYTIYNLNDDFNNIKEALIKYLQEEIKNNKIEKINKIEQSIYSPLLSSDFINKYPIPKLDNILLLNFNYTSTINLYKSDNIPTNIINIHGELNNLDNPIIFGYGDGFDDNYKEIEKTNNKEYLLNLKSFNYSKKNNFRDFLRFINSDEYQVFIMGHSCGTSDKTLLNTLFEHDYCKSIKIFYYENSEGYNNYSDIVMNITKNLNNKSKINELIVSKDESIPLVF